jgi:Isopropylmalate/homocitrate/citramalate synthases
MSSTKKIQLMDTTLRDGEQTQGVSFTPPEKANIAKTLLKKLRVDRIEVTSARISEGELGSVQNIAEWAAENGFWNVSRFWDSSTTNEVLTGLKNQVLLS